MNIVKVLSRHRLLGAAILSMFLLAACGPAPLGTSWAGLTTVGDQQYILVAFNDRLTMVDPVDGKTVRLRNAEGEIRLDDSGNPRLWDIRQGQNQFFATPVLEGENSLLVAGYHQVLYNVDLPTARIENGEGTPIPSNTGNLVADPVVSDDLIYVGLSTKNLVALNRDDYSLAWTAETEHGVWSKPVLVDDTLYFTSLDHNLYAVDARTGASRWTLDLQGAAPASPAYVDGKLYIGSFARKVFEVSTEGKILNSYDTLDWVWNTPTVKDGILYTADLVGNVYALDTTDNLREVWKVRPSTMAIRPSPLVTENYVLVASRDQKLYWLNRDDGTIVSDSEGRPLVREMQAPIFSDILLIEPTEANGITEPMVVVSTLSPGQMLVAYSLEEGRFLWTHSLA
ncbi:MAG: PQQ-like beta-propeller repeat protein [Chloroflexi bacterium]|nr:PQQ-like beta-propeller repeat protein [Chloroflexota bacterium]